MSDTPLLDQLFPSGQERPRRDLPLAGNHVIEGKGARRLEEVSTRWASICTLELQGYTKIEIAAKMGLASVTVGHITRDQRYIDYRNSRLAALDDDFHAMKPFALAALRGGLTSNDENTALRASEQWFKAASFGGYSKTEAPSTSLTAEDVARQLLGVQVNVTVNNVSEPQREALNSPVPPTSDESVG